MKYEDYSKIFKALGHPVRLELVEGLMKGNCCVNNMVKKLDLPQSTVSQHLSILKNAGIIKPHKDGVITCYCVENDLVKKIFELMK